jgi:VWFA-related protein
MTDLTADGSGSVTKNTKTTQITRITWSFVVFVTFVLFVPAREPLAGQAPQSGQQPPTQAQQRPVFRAGTHFVRVDAYPLANGKIVAGLTPEDFEVFEDGKRQAVESFDFITFEGLTPEAERHDPVSQRAGFDLAADPRYRVFVVYVDMALSKSTGAFSSTEDLGHIQQPLINFFEQIIGPRDLYGFMTTRNSVKDLVLAQKTTVTVGEIKDLWRANVIERDEADEVLGFCGAKSDSLIDMLKMRFRADATYTTLRDLVTQLGTLRQERKNLVLVTNLLPRWREDRTLFEAFGGASPRAGINRGRITNDNREVVTTGGGNANGCAAEVQRLALMDFEPRYRELLGAARRENVSVYTITPGGLQAPVRLGDQRNMKAAYDDLKSLADETGGIAVTDTNDLNAGFKRIADDLAAYYVLGYYTTNTTFDGGLRKISVKVKGQAIRARREYRAPTEAEIAAMASPPATAAPKAEQGPPAVIGEPVAYRIGPRQAVEQVRLLEFVRSDRLRVRWPVLAPLDRRDARLLDSAGKAMAFDLPVSEDAAGKTLIVELPLAPLGRGVYSIELTAASGGRTERRRLTFMMK